MCILCSGHYNLPSVLFQVVPPNFEKAGYLNEMPLSSWIKDLNRRMGFLNNWVEIKLPIVCWISGFFFPQAYLHAPPPARKA